jgi:hypothetical protein
MTAYKRYQISIYCSLRIIVDWGALTQAIRRLARLGQFKGGRFGALSHFQR